MSGYTYEGEDSEVVAVAAVIGVGPLVYSFPQAVRQKLVAVAFHLATAAGGGNRIPVVTLTDGSGVLCASVAAPFTLAGASNSDYTFGEDLGQYGGVNALHIGGPFVGGWLPQNITLGITVVNAIAGDKLTNVRLIVCQRPLT